MSIFIYSITSVQNKNASNFLKDRTTKDKEKEWTINKSKNDNEKEKNKVKTKENYNKNYNNNIISISADPSDNRNIKENNVKNNIKTEIISTDVNTKKNVKKYNYSFVNNRENINKNEEIKANEIKDNRDRSHAINIIPSTNFGHIFIYKIYFLKKNNIFLYFLFIYLK